MIRIAGSTALSFVFGFCVCVSAIGDDRDDEAEFLRKIEEANKRAVAIRRLVDPDYVTVRRGHHFIPLHMLAKSQYVPCTVTKVIDGDTLVISIPDGRVATFHLLSVDAPELDQPFGPEAKAGLEELVLGKQLIARFYSRDAKKTTRGPYGWAVGLIFVIAPGEIRTKPDDFEPDLIGDKFLGCRLAKRGYAWARTTVAYETNVDFPKDEFTKRGVPANSPIPMQQRAQEHGRGLWRDSDPIAPWNWRGEKRLVASGDGKTPDQIRYLVSGILSERAASTLAERACRQLEVKNAVVGFYTRRELVLEDNWKMASSNSRHGVALVRVKDGEVLKVRVQPNIR